MTPPLLICETANVHGGDPRQLIALVNSLAAIDYPSLGVKFHPIAADTLALSDFSYYDLYQNLQISEDVWAGIIGRARTVIGSIWIEVADLNCVRVLTTHLSGVAGIKLQTSVLENHEVLSALSVLDLSRQTIMLNVAGQDIAAIESALARFRALGPARLALQIGFQAYPTPLDDLLLNKLTVLQAAFPDVDLALADHVAGEDVFAQRVPLLAAALGCRIIEKHVCLDRATTQYDGSAALEPAEINSLAGELLATSRCFDNRFITPGEATYLAKTLQRPVSRAALPAGSLVAPEDLLFRRTDQPGLSFGKVHALQTQFQILAEPVAAGTSLTNVHFRPAHVATIVAGRMKSTRLPKKATLRVKGIPSVERCLSNCLRLPHVQSVVLATSTHPDDDILEQHTLGNAVGFWRGPEDDVIQRYLGACDRDKIDVVVRVTADCLTVSPEITGLLLEAHFSSGADFTRARREAPGSAPQIFNTETLRRIDRLTGGAIYSEYMNQYVENNPDIFKICWVDLPEELIGDYRLTLDYEEDLQMYEQLFTVLDATGRPSDLMEIFRVFAEQPSIAAINASIQQVYIQNDALIETLRQGTKIVPSAT